MGRGGGFLLVVPATPLDRRTGSESETEFVRSQNEVQRVVLVVGEGRVLGDRVGRLAGGAREVAWKLGYRWSNWCIQGCSKEGMFLKDYSRSF